jgi:type VI secretion system secreted protein VgrG
MGELMAITQEKHRIAITTPLGKDVLLLRGFSGSEAISQLFHFDLDLLSENDSIKFQDVVGKNVTLHVNAADGSKRHFNGFISRFSQGAQDGRLTAYRAQFVPWLWFLTRTADCRIFQNQKAPDIIKKIFSDLKFHDFELRLFGAYTPRDYCVQYRETDFNFVSRLMEEEGICYYFDHQDGKHVLILADDPSAHKPCPNQKTARCGFYGRGITYEGDLVTEWHYHEEFRPGAWAQTDYNFETPSTSLAVTVNGKNSYEIYEYPGEHSVRSQGDQLARIRLQEQAMPCVVSHGASMCRDFRSGFQFTLEDHYRSDLNQAYLITAIRHTAAQAGNYQVGMSSGEEMTYRNSFECIPFATPFRPPRVTPQPFVQGCQTAVVVGPGGEEIYTDKFGRVKVQFHWDREGKKNENSSCWVRVSHPWAGQGWGSVSIPRIGQEVIVDFLEGNPDQPIIVGRVYNAEQMPPFGMPGGAMVSGIKSNSTKGGGGFNEISLNDTKGNELINIHAQFDQQKKVERDERVDIGRDRTEHVVRDEKITIDHNRTEEVKNDEKITIRGNRTEDVTKDETITITGNRTETVKLDETHSIKGKRSHTVSKSEDVTVKLTRTHNVLVNDMLNVGAAQEVNVVGAQTITVGALRAKTVIGNETVTIKGSQTIDIKGDETITVKGDETITVKGAVTETTTKDHTQTVKEARHSDIGKDDTLKVGKILTIEADGDHIMITCGKASLQMKHDGTIEMQGKDISFCASGNFGVEAKGEVEIIAKKDMLLKGKSIGLNP